MDAERNREIQKKAFFYTAIIFAVLTLVSQWYITQTVAAECNCHPLLGRYLAIGDMKIYPPFGYFLWSSDEVLTNLIPDILRPYSKANMIVLFISLGIMFLIKKSLATKTSHGSAAFANKEDIEKSDLGEYASKNGGVFTYEKRKGKIFGLRLPFKTKHKIVKDSGVVVGINPYTKKLMLHDGVEHMLLMAPTRSGKGVCTIIPTGLIWKHSIFFFDPKCELWNLTSGYRQKYLGQKVLKFQPLCNDGSAARWNPLAEISYRTSEELSDVSSIVSVMVRPDGDSKGGDDFWPNAAAALINGVILHLLYKHDKENLPLPCPTDIMSFLSSPDKDTKSLFTAMRDYPHIRVEEFMEEIVLDAEGKPVMDENGREKHYKNPLKEIYGEYIRDFNRFTEALGVTVRSIDDIRIALQVRRKLAAEEYQKEKEKWEIGQKKKLEEFAKKEIPQEGTEAYEKYMAEKKILEEEKYSDMEDPIDWSPPNLKSFNQNKEQMPYYLLLVHPKVAECAANILNGATQTTASIMQTAQTSMAIYQDPTVQQNTSVSDFAIRDLLDPKQEVSLYFCMQVKEIATVRPIARLFLQLLCAKLIRDMKFETDTSKPQPKKQRLLLMLDEFPQLGNMQCIELALAICAGYGIKMCIVSQDVNQLNKAYTKDNSIGSNCHVHIYFTPNIDAGGATAEAISKTLGKRTIDSVSHSDGGGGWFKGSNSTSQMGRELMTPDEVSQMSSEKELVFVAGHRPIYGDKLRYYLQPWLLKRTEVPRPMVSDTVTSVTTYAEMTMLQAADRKAKEEDIRRVAEEKARRGDVPDEERLGIEARKKFEEYEKALREAEEKEKKNAATEDDAKKGSDKEGQSPASDQNHQGNDARATSAQAVEESYDDYVDDDPVFNFINDNRDLIFKPKTTSAKNLLQDNPLEDFPDPDPVDANMDSLTEIVGNAESEGKNES